MTTKVTRNMLNTSIVDNGNATAITIDANENLGLASRLSVGTTTVPSGNTKAVLTGGNDNYLQMVSNAGNGGVSLGNAGGGNLLIYTHTGALGAESFSERMRVTSDGKVGIATTSPSALLQVNTPAGGTTDAIIISRDTYGTVGTLQNSGGNLIVTSNKALTLGSDPTSSFTSTSSLIKFEVDGSERMRIDSSGNVLMGTTSGSTHFIKKAVSVGSTVLEVTGNNLGTKFFNADGGSPNSASSAMDVFSVGATGRSINASGTVNTGGNDYAEYMKKTDSCGTIAKGDVCGVDSNGKLTDVFADAMSFVIKSTNPSYVGGDNWGGTELNLTVEQYEAERQKYDRIAFSGRVPVNITGSFNVGDYIYPQASGTNIEAVAKANPTFEEYQLCVGKIWSTEDDGRPLVAVKIG